MKELFLPQGKSIINRLLVIYFLKGENRDNIKINASLDTLLMSNLIKQIEEGKDKTFFCYNAATITRFIISILALKKGFWIVDAQEQMQKNRPIYPLVDALRLLGAKINYLDKENNLPISIEGGLIRGGIKIEIDNTITSQVVSSLLLISPYLKGGLEIGLKDNKTSFSYINLTISLMRQFGILVEKIGDNIIKIPESEYKIKEIEIENDWSSACFAYEQLALQRKGEIFIRNLFPNSLQADSKAKDYFSLLGIRTQFIDKNIILSYDNTSSNSKDELSFNLIDSPDMFPSLAVSGYFSGKKVIFYGINNLQYKESNRLSAVEEGLISLGAKVIINKESFTIMPIEKSNIPNKNIIIKTYDDHRIAMAFYLVKLIKENLEIDNRDCISKSFPLFFENFNM
ncbi:MAG: hypothetical protein LBM25_03590 [Bacteroidales bacterium]|nr:hypothetical protein [Bacteroidales bacterium]